MKKIVLNDYESGDKIGEGGNAEVYKIKRISDGAMLALKKLVNKNAEKKQRFIDEINIMKKYEYLGGIMPIIDYSEEEYSYVMPIAEPIQKILSKSGDDDNEGFVIKVVTAIIEFASILSVLHKEGISHRDIKPDNLYCIDGKCFFGDFGLVEFPDNPNAFTCSDRGLGAIFTIAPEMKRDPKHSDGKKADVYSLAKTMWILLTGIEKCFDGAYNFQDKQHGLRYIEGFENIHIVELENLLKYSTSNDPYERPTIDEFKTALEKYLTVLDDFELSQKSDWDFMNQYLFPFGQASSSWVDIDKIILVLNIIGTSPAYNHMMFSGNGGLDFKYAEIANEAQCIYIYDTLGFCHIIKPKKLIAETFGTHYAWNYFLLELDELQPVFNDEIEEEKLVEDFPAHYVSAQYSQYGVYDYDEGTPFPEGYKVVYRYLRGKFLFVLKSGPYNDISGTYDGRHGMCVSNEFKKYIELLIRTTEELKLRGIDESRILNSKFFNKNPFKKEDDKKIEHPNYPDKFIQENYSTWFFEDYILKYNAKDDCCKFYIHFYINSSFDFSDMIDRKAYYLCKDGYIRKSNNTDDNLFYCSSRDDAISLKKQIEERINNICTENGFNEPLAVLVSIEIDKHTSVPTHLFTKDEIKIEMKKADDRVHNQLVIDEYGYAHVVRDRGYGHTYPVSLESWDAGNIYVGKYSPISTLDENYIECLQGWLAYLHHGGHQKMDYLEENDDEIKLIDCIREFY